MFKETVGIDVSKNSLDVRIHTKESSANFANTTDGFTELIKWVFSKVTSTKEETLFAFEHTGLYSYQLSVYLTENNHPFILIPGLEVKQSMGMRRGKDDKADSIAIALYAYRKREEVQPYKLASEKIIEMKRLLSLREKLVKQKAGYEASLNEINIFLDKKKNKTLFKVQETMLEEISKQLKIIEKELDDYIKNDDVLNNQFKLITSIKGVGKQTAIMVIALTNAFTSFTDWRKFACYSGIAPFPYSSGTSIKGRNRVSNLANKRMKSLLDRCAVCAIQYNEEMKKYYHRRVAEGKSKMSTINAIRNKMVARIFAVIKRETPYVDIYKYSA